jgi:hypothetical protein
MAIISEFGEDERARREASEQAGSARGCGKCGRTFDRLASWQVAHDPSWPGGCVPSEVAGLTEVDGVFTYGGRALAVLLLKHQ